MIINFITNTLLLIGSFIAMEGVAWFTHKYIMHGIGWFLHKDHHQKDQEHFFERNDFFFLFFAIPGIILIYLGTFYGTWTPFLWIGSGITLYGFCYFLVHDIFIHQRFKIFSKTNNTYFRAIRKAHKVHHKHLSKEQGECFGMLYVPKKYFTEAKNARLSKERDW
jgi:beta-carotene 3-hydroxylase